MVFAVFKIHHSIPNNVDLEFVDVKNVTVT